MTKWNRVTLNSQLYIQVQNATVYDVDTQYSQLYIQVQNATVYEVDTQYSKSWKNGKVENLITTMKEPR